MIPALVLAALAYTPSDLTVAQILAKSKAAYGTLAPGSYVITERSHSGGVDRTFVTRVNGADEMTTGSTGPFTSAYGVFHGQSWTQDDNGLVLLASGFHEKIDPDALAWAHPEDPANHVHVLGITTTEPREYVIESNPPHGHDQFRYYDATTMLLVQAVSYGGDRHRHVSDFSDYRTVFGEVRAFHTHYSDGRSDNDDDTTVVSFERDPHPDTLGIPISRSLFNLTSNAPVTIPATFTDQGIVIRATINGRGLDFVLDSGSTDFTIDPAIVHDLHLQSYGKQTGTAGGDIDSSDVMVPRMQIGPLTFTDLQVEAVPFSANAGDSHIVGLIGCDFIGSGVLGIDFQRKTLTLYPRGSFDPKTVGALASAPLEVDDCLPRAPVTVESVSGNVLIDTGSFTTMLFQRFLDRLPSIGGSDSTLNSFEGVGGSVRAQTYVVDNLIFGGVRFDAAQVVVPRSSTWDVQDYDGDIGRNLLSHYAIFFDYTDRMVYFKPEKT